MNIFLRMEGKRKGVCKTVRGSHGRLVMRLVGAVGDREGGVTGHSLGPRKFLGVGGGGVPPPLVTHP